MGFNITKDNRYLQIETIIWDTHTGLKFDIEHAHPAVICEMFKNQFSYTYKNKLMESNELFSKMKQLIYPLIEFDRDLVLEYEVRYGMNLIFESSENHNYTTGRIIEESWDFVKTKILGVIPVTQELMESWLSDTWDSVKKGGEWVLSKGKQAVKWVGDKLKQAGAWILNKGLPWFFSKLESFLLSPFGIGIDVALNVIGVGKIATAIIWGALGVWKIYQLFTGKIANDIWSYVDIAICLVGLVLTGGAALALKKGIQAAGKSTAKLLKLPVIKTIVQLLGKGLNFIANAILKPIEWLAKNVGGPKIQQMVSVAKSKIAQVFDGLNNFLKGGSTAVAGAGKQGIRGTLKQGIKTDIINPAKAAIKNPALIKKAAIKGTTWGLATHGALKGIEHGVDAYVDWKAAKNSDAVNQAINQIASNDDMVKGAVSTEMDALQSQFSALDNTMTTFRITRGLPNN